MIEFSINGKDYQVADVTIGQFYKIQHLLIIDAPDAKLEIVSYLSGCPLKELKTLEHFEFMQLFSEIANGPLNTEKDRRLYKHIGLNGKAYGLLEFNKITIGEFADMDVLKADPANEKKLHVMMAILYRPAVVLSESNDWIQIEPYDSDSLDARATEFLDLPLKYVYSALSFFLLIPKYLLNDMTDSLALEMMEKMKTEKDPKIKEAIRVASLLISELQEDGTTPSTMSLEMIYSRLMKLQELMQHSSLTT